MTSRPHANGRTRRRRCSAGHRFTTIEVVTTGKPRRLLGLELSDIRLAKAKTIASITALLERAL
jgi:transcriptional regulator NrdR family protein